MHYEPGYYYVLVGTDWEIWMWTGDCWYEPGEAEARDEPLVIARVPQAPSPPPLAVSPTTCGECGSDRLVRASLGYICDACGWRYEA